MCAQWSKAGYVRTGAVDRKPTMTLADWKRVVDEAAAHGAETILVRGGEPFLLPGIVDLLDHAAAKGFATSIDSNGTRLGSVADDLVRIGGLHVTVSVDGPEEVHDEVRGVRGSYRQIVSSLTRLREAERRHGRVISKSIAFTISPWSYRGLGAMPDVARALGIDTLCIVPYYYVPERLGLAYERELREELGCDAFSWRGFHHETSGIDFEVLREQLRLYRARLGALHEYPYLPLSEDEYRTWFESPHAPVLEEGCPNLDRLIDIQPTGDANSCVDFPDYSFGNVRETSIAELWGGARARRFRERRRTRPFSACHRCGAKYMGWIRG
jgi:radical SAM protein with 4Fe4S-binding SPASM domain